jgi:hypothetical protein
MPALALMSAPAATARRLMKLLGAEGRPPAQRRRLVALIELLAGLGPPPDPCGLYPSYARLREELLAAIAGTSGEALEQAFLELYCHLHGHEAPYTTDERATVDRSGGYWCHAGGLTPILKAPDWIAPASRSADFGAGNGLQLLLVQKLAPHARTVQVEISATMCAAGRELQHWLGVPADRVEWRHADVTNQSPLGFDFIYLYRPVRPEGPGIDFYRRFARDLDQRDSRTVVFSVADCLGGFLPPTFERFYFDGHLACYRNRGLRTRRQVRPLPRVARGR